MQLKVGTFGFLVNGVRVTSSVAPEMSDAQIPVAFVTRLDIRGFLEGSSQSDLTAQQTALETLLKVQGQDIVLLQDSGAESATKVKSANSISGVIIDKGPIFSGETGAEYATQREFSFSCYVKMPASNRNKLVKFAETLTYTGGGPTFEIFPAISGGSQKQMIYPSTPYVVTQDGSAVGLRDYPDYPGPIFGVSNLMSSPDIRRMSPMRIGKGYQNFGVTWTYRFKSISPLVKLPNVWIE